MGGAAGVQEIAKRPEPIPPGVTPGDGEPSLPALAGALSLIWLALFLIALTGYPDLSGNERRISGYAMDAIQYGHWMIQRDAMGSVASKPPMLTWLVSLVALCTGGLSRLALYLPSALAALGTSLTILCSGRRWFGWRAGLLGGLSWLICPAMDAQLTTARYDTLLTFPVTLGAVAAFLAWLKGRGWTWFWLCAAMATMVKGPLGALLAAAGLLAALWEWRSGTRLRLRGSHLTGLAIYMLICGGWFALAYWQMGQPLTDKMLWRELVKHSVGAEDEGLGGALHKPLVSLLQSYLPWCALSLLAIWRLFMRPSKDDETRRFERFVFCWFLSGLLVFSIAPHQRGRLILPLIPAMAILTGREMDRLLAGWDARRIRKLAAGVTALGIALLFLERHVLMASDSRVQDTLALQSMAAEIRDQVGTSFPLTHLDSPSALQFYLGTFHPWIRWPQAPELVREDAAVFLVVRDVAKLKETLGTGAPPLYELMSRRMNTDYPVHILSNHPRLEWAGALAAIIGPLHLRLENATLALQRGNDLLLERAATGPSLVAITNISDQPQQVRARFRGGSQGPPGWRRLAPGETWRLEGQQPDHPP